MVVASSYVCQVSMPCMILSQISSVFLTITDFSLICFWNLVLALQIKWCHNSLTVAALATPGFWAVFHSDLFRGGNYQTMALIISFVLH